MTIPERAEFLLALVTADQMMVPAPLAKKLAECQTWLETMAEDRADPLRSIDGDKGAE